MIEAPRHAHNNDNSIRLCQIHDLLRDVAIQKAEEDDFMTVHSTRGMEQRRDQARRVSVTNLDCNEWMKYANPNLRTLLCFNSKFPDFSGQKLLKVLSDMSPSLYYKELSSDREDMKWLGELSQLRYLELHEKTIMWNQRYFEKSISSMKFLQTLSLTFYRTCVELPDCLWDFKTLRHVKLFCKEHALGPPPTKDLPNLQTLIGVRSRESWAHAGLPNLPNLREIGIEITEGFPWELVAAFLRTLKYLVKLTMRGEDIPTEVVDMRGFPFYQHLTYLHYRGRLPCHGFEVAMFPVHLTQLILRASELRQQHLEVLEKLQELKELSLCTGAYPNHTMKCSAGSFPQLQLLDLTGLHDLEEWEIEKGAMPMLRALFMRYSPALQVPQGLQHLTSLSELICLFNHSDDLKVPHGVQHITTLNQLSWQFNYHDKSSGSGPRKAKEIRDICKHVSSISIHGVQEDSRDH
jgi:hypothetical protein